VRALAWTAVFLLALPGFGEGPPPAISALSASLHGRKVSVSFRLDGAFANGETIEALESGLPTALSYDIEIVRRRPRWLDSQIATARIEVICTFNSVTREYLLNYRRDDHLVRSETFTDFEALKKRMTTIEEIDLFNIEGQRPWKLVVRARADLGRSWLMYIIPWSVDTGWRETRIVTNGAAAP
jgi:hypothetical protein